jgi:opacity protein-like surface antigen
MKKLLLITLSLATAVVARAADVPEKEDLTSMTETSLISFGQAVKKKDFSGFYEDIASVWQKQTTAEKLEELFKDFLDKGIDLPAAIKGKEPVFNQPASINSDGVLIVKGYYPTTPNRIVFQLKYLQEEDEWKLIGIDVNLKE